MLKLNCYVNISLIFDILNRKKLFLPCHQYTGLPDLENAFGVFTSNIPTLGVVFYNIQNKNIMISELKAFLLRGDVLALAVAVIIAGAFQKIVDSLVNDVIMPILGMIIGSPDFSGIMIGSIKIGNFITAIFNFILIGIVLFGLLKAAGKKAE